MASLWYIGPGSRRSLSEDDIYQLTEGGNGEQGSDAIAYEWSSTNGFSIDADSTPGPIVSGISEMMPDEFILDPSDGYNPRPNSPIDYPDNRTSPGWNQEILNSDFLINWRRRPHGMIEINAEYQEPSDKDPGVAWTATWAPPEGSQPDKDHTAIGFNAAGDPAVDCYCKVRGNDNEVTFFASADATGIGASIFYYVSDADAAPIRGS